MSICSKSGIEWVFQKTGSLSFGKLATKLTYDICRRLKVENMDFHIREPEPEPDTAWAYVRAYFNETVEGDVGLIHRPYFEARLKAHFGQAQMQPIEQDPAWYALRNIVYAAGSRFLSWKRPFSGFRYDEGPGWKYFTNAFSVYTELHFCRTSLMAVQALAAMVSPAFACNRRC